jgi:hypothetical protein
MHPTLSKELIRALQHDDQERVGKPRVPRAASRKRWFRRACDEAASSAAGRA